MRLVSLLLLVPLVGCIALVPSYEPTEHCELTGDTACATCMRISCQTEIDACCGASACHETAFLGSAGTTIAAVDTCGRGEKTCATSLDYATKTPEGEKVRICVQSTCKAECAPGAIATKWTCEAPRTETAPCAACIYSKCSAQITSCCGGSSCASFYGIEDDLSACISGDELACAYRLRENSLSGESGEGGVLRKCVREDCGTKCMGDGSVHRRCNLQSGGTYCSCSDAPATMGDECSTAKIGGGHCYETEQGCSCGQFACTFKTTGSPSCRCSLSNGVQGGDGAESCNFELLSVKPTSPDATCCLDRSGALVSCTCDTLRATCSTGETPVLSCDRDYLLDNVLKPYETSVCSK